MITGEGRLDAQTLNGKLVHQVAKECKRNRKEMTVVCGANSLDENQMVELGSPFVYALNVYNLSDYHQFTTQRDLKKVALDILN